MTLFPHHNALPRPASNEPPPTLDALLPCGCRVRVRRDHAGAIRLGRVLRPAGHVAHLVGEMLTKMGVA